MYTEWDVIDSKTLSALKFVETSIALTPQNAMSHKYRCWMTDRSIALVVDGRFGISLFFDEPGIQYLREGQYLRLDKRDDGSFVVRHGVVI